jgi:hypothetical protein
MQHVFNFVHDNKVTPTPPHFSDTEIGKHSYLIFRYGIALYINITVSINLVQLTQLLSYALAKFAYHHHCRKKIHLLHTVMIGIFHSNIYCIQYSPHYTCVLGTTSGLTPDCHGSSLSPLSTCITHMCFTILNHTYFTLSESLFRSTTSALLA